MALLALGAFAGVLLLVAVNLFEGGFSILDLGYKGAAIGAWIGSGSILIGAIYLSWLARKTYRIQKAKEKEEDYTRRTGKLR